MLRPIRFIEMASQLMQKVILRVMALPWAASLLSIYEDYFNSDLKQPCGVSIINIILIFQVTCAKPCSWTVAELKP